MWVQVQVVSSPNPPQHTPTSHFRTAFRLKLGILTLKFKAVSSLILVLVLGHLSPLGKRFHSLSLQCTWAALCALSPFSVRVIARVRTFFLCKAEACSVVCFFCFLLILLVDARLLRHLGSGEKCCCREHGCANHGSSYL